MLWVIGSTPVWVTWEARSTLLTPDSAGPSFVTLITRYRAFCTVRIYRALGAARTGAVRVAACWKLVYLQCCRGLIRVPRDLKEKVLGDGRGGGSVKPARTDKLKIILTLYFLLSNGVLPALQSTQLAAPAWLSLPEGQSAHVAEPTVL